MSGAFGPSGDNSQVYPGFFENPHFAPPILAARTVNAGTMFCIKKIRQMSCNIWQIFGNFTILTFKLNVEAEENDVAVLHHVVLAFHAD